jgi:hypothetical protein
MNSEPQKSCSIRSAFRSCKLYPIFCTFCTSVDVLVLCRFNRFSKDKQKLNTYVHSIIPPNLWNFVVVVIRFAFSSSSLLRRLEIFINFISLEEFRAAKTMLHSLRIQILQVVRNLLHLLYSGWCRLLRRFVLISIVGQYVAESIYAVWVVTGLYLWIADEL